MSGDLADPGVFPVNLVARKTLGSRELFGGARQGVKRDKKKPGEKASRLCEEAVSQEGRGLLEGPFVYPANRKLPVNEKHAIVNPAYRFGFQRTDELGAVGDLRGSPTNEDAAVHTPVYIPSRGHLGQPCEFYRFMWGIHAPEVWQKPITRTRTSSPR